MKLNYLNNMVNLKINKPIKKGTLIGLDLASKSGYAVIKSSNKKVSLVSYGSINIDRHSNELLRLHNTASLLVRTINPFITSKNTLITIENCYLGKWNPRTYGFLSRLSGYIIPSIINAYRGILTINNFKLLYPSTSKKLVGLKGNANKQDSVNYVNNIINNKRLEFKLIHNNICDAIILALAGGFDEEVKNV